MCAFGLHLAILLMQDLCAICTDFIISELWTSNFLAYQVQNSCAASLCLVHMLPISYVIDGVYLCFQVFAESQDYGIHGERVRNACWGYLCQSGSMELKEVMDGELTS